MAQLQRIQATLTSDSSGDATAFFDGAHGYVETIYVENDDTDFPTNNWDLLVATGALPTENVLNDTTVSNSTAAPAVYRPRVQLQGVDGANIANEFGRFLINGRLNITGANMGNVKGAVVTLIVHQLKG